MVRSHPPYPSVALQLTDRLGRLGLTPPQVLKDTLHLSDASIAQLSKDKPLVVQGRPQPRPGKAP